jgi:hypothetical protein
MDKSFDDLFNEFFKNNSMEDRFARMREEAKRMIDLLTNFKDLGDINVNEDVEKVMDGELGEPDEIEYFQDGDMYFERRVWHMPHGDLVKLIASDDPEMEKKVKENMNQTKAKRPTKVKPEKPLDVQLEEALAKEDYEKAAQIRDLMNPPKKRGRPKKSEKKS